MSEPSADRPADALSAGSVGELLVRLRRRPPAFQDESLDPAVDAELIRRLVTGTLSPDEARAAYLLVYSFHSWNAAYVQALIADARRPSADGSDVSSAPDEDESEAQ